MSGIERDEVYEWAGMQSLAASIAGEPPEQQEENEQQADSDDDLEPLPQPYIPQRIPRLHDCLASLKDSSTLLSTLSLLPSLIDKATPLETTEILPTLLHTLLLIQNETDDSEFPFLRMKCLVACISKDISSTAALIKQFNDTRSIGSMLDILNVLVQSCLERKQLITPVDETPIKRIGTVTRVSSRKPILSTSRVDYTATLMALLYSLPKVKEIKSDILGTRYVQTIAVLYSRANVDAQIVGEVLQEFLEGGCDLRILDGFCRVVFEEGGL